MITIRQILMHKGDRIHGIGSQATLAEAARTMSEHGVGALVVRDADAIVGLLSERDLVLALAKHRANVGDETAASTMQPANYIEADDALMDGLKQMTDRRRRHLLVRENGHVVGMVSIGDLVKAVHEEQAGTITSLHQYITG